MTLSLDDVRNKRFRMARKGGYEVLEVDEFVDEVEESFAQLVEENASLKKQVDALRSGSSDSAEPAAEPTTTEAPSTEVAPPQAAAEQPVEPAPVAEPAASTPAPVAQPVVVTTSAEASTAVVRLVQLSTEQAEHLVNEATAEASRIREDAARDAARVTEDARVRADGVHAEAQSRSESLDQELSQRRAELFGDLDQQRDQLTETVGRLRSFEQQYRASLHEHLQGQLDSLEHVDLEPEGGPERTAPVRAAATNDGVETRTGGAPAAPASERTDGDGHDRVSGASDTPRLDALLGEQR